MENNMKVFANLESLHKIKLNLQNEKEKIKKDSSHKIYLFQQEIELFFEKVDIFKFSDRISQHYKIQSIDKLKNFIGVPASTKLTEKKLLLAIKNKDIINDILTNDEKIKLKQLYLEKHSKEMEKEKKEEENRILLNKQLIDNAIKDIDSFISSIVSEEVSSKKIKKYNALKKEVSLLLMRRNQTQEKYHLLEKKFLQLDRLKITRKTMQSKKIGKHHNVDYKEKVKIQEEENRRRLEEYKKHQEEELIKKINSRKESNDGLIEKSEVKDENIIIEAFLSDFDSKKSRFVLSVLKGINIKVSFYNGLIKFIDDNSVLHEIYFFTTNDIITFNVNENELELDLMSSSNIIDLLQKQNAHEESLNIVLNSLSVLYYINTFYANKEKIEVEDLDYQHLVNSKSKSDEKIKKIIYLNNNTSKKIKTIKIKKGKQLTGKSLTRGHWRRQPYSDGNIKLIWIEPFWRGKGNMKDIIYKVSNA